MADKKHAMYLYKDNEGSPKLFHGDDVEAAKANGWKEPEFNKSTGTPWNDEEGGDQRDAAAEIGKSNREIADKKAKEKSDKEEKERKLIEKERAEAPVTPDMKVQIVEPVKAKK